MEGQMSSHTTWQCFWACDKAELRIQSEEPIFSKKQKPSVCLWATWSENLGESLFFMEWFH